MKTIIISGINMKEGGIYTILDNCLQKLSMYNGYNKFKIIALVPDSSMFTYSNIEYVEFPKSKKYWIYRFYYEYFYFKNLSKKRNVDIWLSLHDMSPNVTCKKQFVYCHNPNMFYKPTAKEWIIDYKMGVFGLFYKYLFKINIKKNTNVFVQQHWIKEAFEKEFSIDTVLVAKPEFTEEATDATVMLRQNKTHFFYPSGAKYYKNYEIIFNAVTLLSPEIRAKVQIHFTNVMGVKNRYAKEMLQQHSHKEAFVFLQSLERHELLKYYNAIDCLLFPSKLETWGLPISEAKAFGKPMLIADLPYAKESAGNYEKVSFFDVNKPQELANLITNFVQKTIIFAGNKSVYDSSNQCNNWFDIFDIITKK